MRIEQLKFLLEIQRQKSMKSAAEQLHITPQALSSTIKNLEEELNTTIFSRSNKGIALTEHGKLIVDFAETTIENYTQLLQQLSDNPETLPDSSLKGSLTLYVAPVFMESILPSYITKFKNSYPKIALNLIQRNSLNICHTMQQDMSDDTVGAIIVPYDGEKILTDFWPGDCDKYSYRILNRNSYYAVVPKDSPFANQDAISLRKLLTQPLVDYCAGKAGTAPLIPLLKQYNPNLKTSLTCSSITLYVEAIRNHMGVGVMNSLFIEPDSIVYKQLNDLVLLKLTDPIVTYNCFAYSKKPTPSVVAFLKQFPSYTLKKSDPEDFCHLAL